MTIEFQEAMSTVAGLATEGPDKLKLKDVDQMGERNYTKLVANVQGKPILYLQRLLGTLGAEINADGVFGGNTQEALFHIIGKKEYDLHRGDLATLSDLIVSQMIEQRTPSAPTESTVEQTEQPKPQLSLVDPTGPQDQVKASALLPEFFRQQDPDWKDRELGFGTTIGKRGCAMVCCAMAAEHAVRAAAGFGERPYTTLTPAPRAGESESPFHHLDVFLDQNDGYDGNDIYWGKVCEFVAQHGVTMRYDRVRGMGEADYYTKMAALLAEGVFPIVRILHPLGLHFMLAIRRTDDGRIVVHDPGTRHGDGREDKADNILSTMTRYKQFSIKGLDYFRVV